MRDRPREQEVERRAAAFLEHDLEELVERMAADEEGERLVLVRRPRHQLVEQEAAAAAAIAATPSPNQWAAIHSRADAPSRAPIRVA